MRDVTVLGDGGWGTAVALVLAGNGLRVTMWGYDPDYLDEMRTTRENRRFLPRVPLPAELEFEPDQARALASAELVFVAIPTVYLRGSLGHGRGYLREGVGVVSLTKGIERETLLRPTAIAAEQLGAERVAVLSGPSHAEEVVRGCPTTVTVSSADTELALAAQAALMSPTFRVYTSSDPVGVELGGALKNVIALSAGICIGLELGDNALAALMTRGLAEMTRLGTALGADPLTFSGLSGMGDLVVTCLSPHGRNRRVGLEIGRGRALHEILDEMQQVAEGVTTAESARALGARAGVELPIVEQVWRVLHEDKDPRTAVEELMTREPKPEQR
jgi:glycerol-3-phosphate dehydrogenase (NAD(P)+)